MKSLTQHHKEVQEIADRLKSLDRKRKESLYENYPSNTMRHANYRRIGFELKLNLLDQLISIDEEKMVAWVEPGMPMDRLAEELLSRGFLAPVTPEFKGITVGGAIAGAAIESSSFAYGQFNDTCLAYDLLLGDGTLLRVDDTHHKDLFYGVAGAYGTLGLITLVGLKIIKAKPWVVLSMKEFHGIQEAINFMRESCLHGSFQFVEGIIYSRHKIVIVTGALKDETEVKGVNVLGISSNWWSRWFFQVVKLARDATVKMPIFDYLFRHDRGAFWMGAYAGSSTLFLRYYLESHLGLKKPIERLFGKLSFLDYAKIKDPSILFRFLFGWGMTSRRLYKILHAHTENWFAERFVIQDYYIPLENATRFVLESIEKSEIFPLWLCPVKAMTTPQILSPHVSEGELPKEGLFLDVGIYGLPATTEELKQLNKSLDAECRAALGRKMLYSYNFYSSDEFWEIYSREKYLTLRQKSGSEGVFTSIDEKLGV